MYAPVPWFGEILVKLSNPANLACLLACLLLSRESLFGSVKRIGDDTPRTGGRGGRSTRGRGRGTRRLGGTCRLGGGACVQVVHAHKRSGFPFEHADTTRL